MTAPRSSSGATRPPATFVSKGTLVVVKVSLVGQWKEVSAFPPPVVSSFGLAMRVVVVSSSLLFHSCGVVVGDCVPGYSFVPLAPWLWRLW